MVASTALGLISVLKNADVHALDVPCTNHQKICLPACFLPMTSAKNAETQPVPPLYQKNKCVNTTYIAIFIACNRLTLSQGICVVCSSVFPPGLAPARQAG